MAHVLVAVVLVLAVGATLRDDGRIEREYRGYLQRATGMRGWMTGRMREWMRWVVHTTEADDDDDDDDDDDEEDDDEQDQGDEEQEEEEENVNEEYNVTQLALMTYKIAKSSKIFSLAAAPCWEARKWMPDVVHRLERELHGFEFYCVDTRGLDADGTQKWYGEDTRTVKCDVGDIENVLPESVDLVVSWMGMQQWGIRNSWRFIKALRRKGVKMVLVSNNAMSGNGMHGRINIRKSPLLFNEPRRVIGKVDHSGDVQLLLYDMDALRDGF